MELTKETLDELYTNQLLNDSDIAKLFGTYTQKINKLRRAYGIPTISRLVRNPLTQDVLKECYHKKLMTNKEIADEYGYTEVHVSYLRHKYGIETISQKARTPITREALTEHYIAQKLSDVAVAEIYGVSPAHVHAVRKRLGVAALVGVHKRNYEPIPDCGSFEYQVLLGTLLGDSYLNGTVSKYGARLEMKHSDDQFEWLVFKKNALSSFLSFGETTAVTESYTDWNCKPQHRVISHTHPHLLVLRSQLYDQNGTKMVTRDYLNKLGDVAVSAWFLDDGSRNCGTRSYTLCTNSFSFEENNLISMWFKERYGISPGLVQVRPNQFTLRFYKGDAPKVSDIVKVLASKIPSMAYKIM